MLTFLIALYFVAALVFNSFVQEAYSRGGRDISIKPVYVKLCIFTLSLVWPLILIYCIYLSFKESY